MRKLKAALIGCGRIGTKKHIEAYANNKDVIELVYCSDLNINKAESAAEKYFEQTGLKTQAVGGYDEILDKEIDFVSIATESGYHYQCAVDFLSAGKHILVEKPMALSTQHIDTMISLAKEKNLKLGVCLQNRFNQPIQELKKKIDEGAFGEIFNATARILWNRNREYYDLDTWRGTWELDGGTLMNQCAHNIDLLQWILGGDIDSVYGVIRNFNHPYIETEDFGVGILKFKNGTIGLLEGTSNTYPTNLEETISVFGEKGTVVIGGLAVNKILTWQFDGEDSHPLMNSEDPDTVYGSGHTTLFADYADALINDHAPYITGEEGRIEDEIVLAIYKSTVEKREIKFPVKDIRSTDFKYFVLRDMLKN
jgi:predicted dehydrogenase